MDKKTLVLIFIFLKIEVIEVLVSMSDTIYVAHQTRLKSKVLVLRSSSIFHYGLTKEHPFQETDLQRESRMSAIQAIRSISNWLYWQPLNINGSSSSSKRSITKVLHKLPDPNIAKLKDAAAKRKLRDSKRSNNQTPLNFLHPEDYWAPSNYVLPSSTTTTTTTSTIKKPSVAKGKRGRKESDYKTNENQNSPIRLGLPLVTALFGMASVRLHEVRSTYELKQHLGGSFALEIVNSSWLQYILAAATWYVLGRALVELVVIVGNRNR